MVMINKQERQALDKYGLIKYKKVHNGVVVEEPSLVVTNKEHVGKNAKSYYVVESFPVLAFLGKLDGLNLQKVTDSQLEHLKEKGFLNDSNMQKYQTYVPGAIAFQNGEGQWYLKKIAKLLIEAGVWSASKTKKSRNAQDDMDSLNKSMEDIVLATETMAEM